MEALSFQHYLETQRLISLSEAQATLPTGIILSEDDYVLGLYDLTGEIMRFAITTMATSGELPRGVSEDGTGRRDVLMDLRSLRTRFESLITTQSGGNFKKSMTQKMGVMRTSVEKVEGAVYGMIVRGRERPKGWTPDLGGEERREAVESY